MKKKGILLIIILMIVGFAALSTTLYINGQTNINANQNDFNVYYSDAYVNGSRDRSVITDDTHISFTTTFNSLGQKYVLDYDVTNGSKNYDAELEMVCTGGNEYLTVTNEFDDETILPSLKERTGKLTIEQTKSYTGEDLTVTIDCTIDANAVERTSLGIADRSEITVDAIDSASKNLNADAYQILGEDRTNLLNLLVDTGYVDSVEDVTALIEVESDQFEDFATATFDVSSITEKGDTVVILHYDENEKVWEYITTQTVDENGEVTADFSSFSPVAFIVVNEDGSYGTICSYEPGTEWTYEYTKSSSTFTSPCAGTYKIELWGAQGGNSATGGKGAYTVGDIDLKTNNELIVTVGGAGFSGAGYNGGGTPVYSSFGGGGATDVRIEASNLYSRIMVAAGGSGSSTTSQGAIWNYGVPGGGLIGYNGEYLNYNCEGRQQAVINPAGGGTQITPGIAMTCSTGSCMHGSANPGYFGIGARDNNFIGKGEYGSGGGGAGWYGGGGGTTTNCDITSSASGSSYISGHIGSIGTKSSTSHIYESYCKTSPDLDCSKSYTNYYFSNTQMIDGKGYSWTTTKTTTTSGMPTHDGTGNMTGNTGNGYAKITLVSIK